MLRQHLGPSAALRSLNPSATRRAGPAKTHPPAHLCPASVLQGEPAVAPRPAQQGHTVQRVRHSVQVRAVDRSPLAVLRAGWGTPPQPGREDASTARSLRLLAFSAVPAGWLSSPSRLLLTVPGPDSQACAPSCTRRRRTNQLGSAVPSALRKRQAQVLQQQQQQHCSGEVMKHQRGPVAKQPRVSVA